MTDWQDIKTLPDSGIVEINNPDPQSNHCPELFLAELKEDQKWMLVHEQGMCLNELMVSYDSFQWREYGGDVETYTYREDNWVYTEDGWSSPEDKLQVEMELQSGLRVEGYCVGLVAYTADGNISMKSVRRWRPI